MLAVEHGGLLPVAESFSLALEVERAVDAGRRGIEMEFELGLRHAVGRGLVVFTIDGDRLFGFHELALVPWLRAGGRGSGGVDRRSPKRRRGWLRCPSTPAPGACDVMMLVDPLRRHIGSIPPKMPSQMPECVADEVRTIST